MPSRVERRGPGDREWTSEKPNRLPTAASADEIDKRKDHAEITQKLFYCSLTGILHSCICPTAARDGATTSAKERARPYIAVQALFQRS